ncbi:MAG: 3-oxoacyl-[acyl-carrier-protein] reductase [Betaproteobacteria bacterium TMED156]|nr:MAG: 3-oxoacyl-[acyl-carrier-protein] reductase [Betaproteobacteria bacterium TMED156]|tara:strand:- start:196 stop:954 length:759 start_codon:yes stop_codon:yes gene_type:complete
MKKNIVNHDSTRIVLITGASRGIGNAILKKLVGQNYYVLGTGTSEKSAQIISETIDSLGGRGFGLVLDLSNDNIDDFVKNILKNYGPPAVFINNAGITKDNLLLRMSEKEWDEVIDVNLSSSFRLTKAILRPMIKYRWGRIIFITSIVGLSGNAGQTNYSAAKAGIGGFCRSVAKELASRSITANCIAPGYIETDMTDSIENNVKQNILSNIPLKRFGRPEDVANAVSFLVSEDASYITGVTLNVDGGMFMS